MIFFLEPSDGCRVRKWLRFRCVFLRSVIQIFFPGGGAYFSEILDSEKYRGALINF